MGLKIHEMQVLCRQSLKQSLRLMQLEENRLGHAVMQLGLQGLDLLLAQWLRSRYPVFDQTLYALHRKTAIAGNVAGFGGPRRNRA